jgi:protein-S-isoprenylcysteine O-methyltransferase Ste14
MRETEMNSNMRTKIVRRVVQVVLTTGFQATVLFLAAGTLAWGWAWAFIALYLLGMATAGVLLMRSSPQTIAERGTAEGMRDWDKVVGGLFGIVFFVGMPLVSGLDERFGWTSLAFALHLAGGAVFALGFALFGWSMVSNAHFATVVRLGEEGKHTVCDRGPYRLVRHPGYVGAILQAVGIPILLGSWWGVLAGVVAAALLVVRTMLEDEDLRRELAGYAEYAARVQYRLLPGIW